MIAKLILAASTLCTALLFILPDHKANWHLINQQATKTKTTDDIVRYINETKHNSEAILLAPDHNYWLNHGISSFPNDETLSNHGIQVLHPNDDSIQYCTHGIWIIDKKILIGCLQKKYQVDSLLLEYSTLR